MRVLVSGLILAIAALDFRFGSPGAVLPVIGTVAGLLVGATVIADRLWADRRREREMTAAEQAGPDGAAEEGRP